MQVGPKMKIGLFAVGRPTLQNWGCDLMNHNTVSTYIIISYAYFFSNLPPKEKAYLPTYPPLLSMGRPTANKDIFKSGLKLTDCQYLEFI